MKQKTKFKQTEIGKIPEGWEVKTIDEIKAEGKGAIISGPFGSNIGSRFFVFSGIPVIRGNNLKENMTRFVDSGFVYLTEEKAKELNTWAKREDIIFTAAGTIGQVGIILDDSKYKEYIISNKQLRLRVDTKKAYPLFVFYWFSIPQMVSHIKQRNTGSTIPLINLSVLKSLPLPLPPLPEQELIAKILSDLDAKIELNNKMNQILEYIGQTLFKKWFVDERKGGWKEGKLGDLLENIKESLKPGANLKDRKYVPIDLLSMKKISIESFLPYTKAKSSLIGFEKDDVLVGAMRVYFHRVNLAPFSGITRTTTFVLRPKNKKYPAYTLFLLNQNETIDFANANSKGSTMPYAVWNDSLENMPIIIPDDKTLKQFNELIYPLLSKIRDTIFENQKLSQIRDVLLPKLMNGEIRVK